MEKYKYRALNAKGRPIKGVLGANSEGDLFNQLQSAGLELVSATPLSKKKGKTHFLTKVKIRDLIQLFSDGRTGPTGTNVNDFRAILIR